MAVELCDLYKEIKPSYDVQLLTDSCFDKQIEWVHMVEDLDFIKLLHGNELVFNSGVRTIQSSWLLPFIQMLNEVRAGGLVLTAKRVSEIPIEVIDYCNQIRFPLFFSAWYTPYVDIMRKFSEILIRNEHNETTLSSALKQSICYPDDTALYLNHFEMNGYFPDSSYIIVVLSCFAYNTANGNHRLDEIQQLIHSKMKRVVIYNEKGRLVILTSGHSSDQLTENFGNICKSDPNVYVGIGTSVAQIPHLYRSYENAFTAYELTKTTIPKNLLCYDSLGVYKLLADVKNADIYLSFAHEILGNLMQYDEQNKTDYMQILNTFFEHDCNILETSKALFCHKNTLNYKMNSIKKILGFDIMNNENRTKIMMAFYILRLGTKYYEKKGSRLAPKIESPFKQTMRGTPKGIPLCY